MKQHLEFKMEMDSKPEALDKLDRRLIQLKCSGSGEKKMKMTKLKVNHLEQQIPKAEKCRPGTKFGKPKSKC